MTALWTTSRTLRTLRLLPRLALPFQLRLIQGAAASEFIPEAELAKARRWAASLTTDTIPRTIATVRFDRSGGPGGQHVNTTSSKATVTWPMTSIAAHIPHILVPHLRTSQYYAPSSDSLVIKSQAKRTQHSNENDCYEKLHRLLQDLSKRVIPGETSLEQKEKVTRLQKAENEARLRMKKKHSDKKSARSNKGRGGDY